MVVTLKKMMIFLLYLFGGIIAFLLIYLAADYIFSRVKGYNSIEQKLEKNIIIYVMSNGVHTDLVFPVMNTQMDWKTLFPLENNKGSDKNYDFVAIGWGDKGFYLNTPEWKDLTIKTALIAGLGLGETALHITYHEHIQENELCYQVHIDSIQYQKLITYVVTALERDLDDQAIVIETDAQYGDNDAFYEAQGSYSLFYSCNTWTNIALKEANLPSAYWTVFDKGILRHYK